MNVRVRLADASDADAIVEFGSAVIPAHYTPVLGAAVARRQLTWWSLDRIESAFAAGRIVVAVVGDDITGVAETGELAGVQVIWKLYLMPDFRGRSLGVELLHRAIGGLPAGTDHVLVEHVAGNVRAGKFYEREGFAVVKTEPPRSGNNRLAPERSLRRVHLPRSAAHWIHVRATGLASSLPAPILPPHLSQVPYAPDSNRAIAASISMTCNCACRTRAPTCDRSNAIVAPSGSCSSSALLPRDAATIAS